MNCLLVTDADGDLLQRKCVGANALDTEHKYIIESTAGATIFDIDIMVLFGCLHIQLQATTDYVATDERDEARRAE